jgi:hypothetical protein
VARLLDRIALLEGDRGRLFERVHRVNNPFAGVSANVRYLARCWSARTRSGRIVDRQQHVALAQARSSREGARQGAEDGNPAVDARAARDA